MRLKLGKVEREVLERIIFRRLGSRRGDVLVKPKFGEDGTIIKTWSGDLVVAAMDPITGSGSMIGWLAVHINANDVSVMGGKPRWFSATILLPERSNIDELKQISSEIDRAAKSLDVAVITGHTEVAPGIEHVIIVGHMLGRLVSRSLITSSNARAGDLILMSKTAGIEGTAILASDFSEKLSEKLPREVLRRARGFYRRISVVDEALRLARGGLTEAMHDPTEGGLLGGVYEMAEASKLSFIIYEDRIRVAKETRLICDALGCDPLKLISSGVLIASIPEEKVGRALKLVKGLRVIGEFRRRKFGNVLIRSDRSEERVRAPIHDELWRLIEELG